MKTTFISYITFGMLSVLTLPAISQPQVTYPNGGETLHVGDTVTITWTGTPIGSVVGIDYTFDNWGNTTWIDANYQNPSANSMTWVVPNTPGTECQVGVFDENFNGDMSDGFFTIAPAMPTGLENEKTANAVRLYPNPSLEEMTIIFHASVPLRFLLLNMTGQQVKVAITSVGNGQYRLRRGNLASGTYTLQILDQQSGTLLNHQKIAFTGL